MGHPDAAGATRGCGGIQATMCDHINVERDLISLCNSLEGNYGGAIAGATSLWNELGWFWLGFTQEVGGDLPTIVELGMGMGCPWHRAPVSLIPTASSTHSGAHLLQGLLVDGVAQLHLAVERVLLIVADKVHKALELS